MIYRLSDAELKEAQTIEESYQRLIKESEKKLLELRSDEPPREDASAEAFTAWLDAGSKEWHKERRKRSELIRKSNETIRAYFESIYDAHFKKIADDPDAIVEDAIDEIDNYIPRVYANYKKLITKSDGFSARFLRATENGFLLDTDETIKSLSDLLADRHIKGLGEDKKRIETINKHLVQVVTDSALVSNTVGELGGLIRREVGLTAQPLDKATVIITRLMNVAFNGKKTLERDYNKDFGDPTNRYDLGLYSKDCPYNLKVAIDYNAMIDNELVKLPALTRLAKHIYDAIVSYWLQGNYTPTYRQIWRATCGNIKREIKYGTKEKLAIEKALLSFKASIAFSTGEIVELNDKNVVKVKEAGGAYQLLHYDTKYLKINGQRTDVLLLDPNKRPVLLEIAQALNNEYMTDNINFFDVRGLVATEENLDLKEYLFIRIKKMKNPNNHVKQKKIALDTLVEDLGIKPFDKSNPKDRVRKSRLVERITKILDNAVDVNFIEGYSANKRKGSTEVISFTIELYKKKSSVSSVS